MACVRFVIKTLRFIQQIVTVHSIMKMKNYNLMKQMKQLQEVGNHFRRRKNKVLVRYLQSSTQTAEEEVSQSWLAYAVRVEFLRMDSGLVKSGVEVEYIKPQSHTININIPLVSLQEQMISQTIPTNNFKKIGGQKPLLATMPNEMMAQHQQTTLSKNLF